jgi:DNA-binding beta-propeller fold protein YncE
MTKTFFIAGIAALSSFGTAFAQDIYVSNNGNSTLAVINEATNGVTDLSSSLLNGPTGLAINPANGNVYIANNGGGDIVQYDPNTNVFSTFATGLNNPRGLAFDSQGNLYVANQSTGIIDEIAAGTTTPTPFTSTVLNTPNGIAIDAFGDIYVALGGSGNEMARIDPHGNVIDFNPSNISNNPNGIAFGPTGDLYVVNRNTPAVNQITPFLTATPFIFGSASGLSDPKGIAFDENGFIFVTDNGNNTVTEYNSSGSLVHTFTSGFSNPNFATFAAGSLPVPEPSTYALLLGGIGALYIYQRRRMVATVRF